MALINIELFLLVKVIDAHPSIATAAGDEAPLLAVQGNTSDFVGRFDRFDEPAWFEAVEEVSAVAGRDGEDAPTGTPFGGEGVEFAAAHDAFDFVFFDGRAGAQVPPANFLVVRGGDEDIEVGAPDDAFDCTAVDARADFVAWGLGGVIAVHCAAHAVWAGGGGGIAAAAGEVEDAELLLCAAGCKNLGSWLGGEGDGADDMGVLEGVQAFAGVGVPYFAVEEGSAFVPS